MQGNGTLTTNAAASDVGNTSPSVQGITQIPSAPTSAGNGSIPLPWAIAGSIALVLLGALAKYLFDRLNAKANQPKKSLLCRATFCSDLLSPTFAQWQDDLELRAHGHLLANPVVVHYQIEYTGNTPAKAIAMKVRCAKNDRIIRWSFYVDEDLKCSRLATKSETETELQFEWSFLNPNDTLELVLLISPCADVRSVALEIDGEGVVVTHRAMAQDCSACAL